jgi:hypothetical protein
MHAEKFTVPTAPKGIGVLWSFPNFFSKIMNVLNIVMFSEVKMD